MKGHSPKHISSSKDPRFETCRTNPENHQLDLASNLQIVGLEQVENDLPQEEYYPQEVEIQKFGYVFKKEQPQSDGPEYDRVCPLCGQFVIEGSPYLVYYCRQHKRKFLSHYPCLMNRDTQRFGFIEIPDQIDDAVLRHESHSAIKNSSGEMSHSYYATLTISHPISNLIYLQLDKKISGWDSEELLWVFGNRQSYLYSPNTICLPYTDFKFSLTVDYRKIIKKHEFFVNLNRRESKKKNQVQASTSSITLQMEVLTLAEQKQAVVSQMNYIYPFTKNFVVVKLNQVRIKIPEQLEELWTCTSQKKINSEAFSSPTIPQSQNDYLYQNNEQHMYHPGVMHTSILVPEYVTIPIQHSPIQHSPMHRSSQAIDGYYNDINELIQSGKIKQFVESSTGSREFQKYLKKCSLEEVEQVLVTLYDDLPEFIVDDYANYMFQVLVQVCSPEQRLRIINKIAPSLPVSAQNKKGTHSLQKFVSSMTTGQEISVVCKALDKDLIMLSCNENATHFIQKIISTFDPIHLTDFFNQFLKEFIKLSKDKQGICVLKAFMKKVHDDQMKNAIANSISSNLDIIIQDPYGNYIVQCAYEMFGQDKCKKITEQIINKFTQYCIQKFSVNVVEKCITTYCTNIHAHAVASIVEANSLEQILKTPTGNSILLKLVKQHPDKEIEDKIRKILSLPRMAKFSGNWDDQFGYSSMKAATCKNVKGETFNNFSQAAEMARTGKAKKGSFTPKVKKF